MFRWRISIPANTTATVYLPTADAGAVTEGGIGAARAAGVRATGHDGRHAIFEAGSGTYEFAAPLALVDAADTVEANA
jgi:alpha-L-rhamnosidase